MWIQRRLFYLSCGSLCVVLAAALFAVPAYAQNSPPVPVNDFEALVSNDLLLGVPVPVPAPTLAPWAIAVAVGILLLVAYVTLRRTRGAARITLLAVLALLGVFAVARADTLSTLLGNAVAHLHRPLATERDFTDAEKAAVAATIAAPINVSTLLMVLVSVRCRLRFFNREAGRYLAEDISQQRQEWMGTESGRGEEPRRWRRGSGLCHRMEQVELCDEWEVDCRPRKQWFASNRLRGRL